MNKTISFKIDEENILKLIDAYKNNQIDNSNQYIRFAAKTIDYSVTLYTSNKVVFQGSNFIEDAKLFGYSEFEWKYNFSHIGSDEVGTGDFFGPVVVVSSYANQDQIKYLEDLGIKDSKKLSDEFIKKTVPLIIKKFPHIIMILDNNEYNKIKDEYNLNSMKANMHNTCLYKLGLKTKCNEFVVDQFCKPETYFKYLENEKNVVRNINFDIKGESKSIAVALSSMIARYTFLYKIDELNKKYKLNIPLGAGSKVEEYAKELLESKGINFLNNIAKLNYKTINKI